MVNRLAAMSLPEVCYRLYQALRAKLEQWAIGTGWSPKNPTRCEHSSVDLFPVTFELESIKAGFSSFSGQLQSGRIDLFDYQGLDVGSPVRWHVDPLTQTQLDPGAFGKSIDYRDEHSVGDIKVVWELGRQQYLVPIAIHYLIDRDPRHLSLIADVVGSWLDQNPFGRGIHWCSSLEVALRGISWAVTHQILRAAGVADGLFSLGLQRDALEQSLYQHAWFIRHFLSRFSSGNNHLVGELTGLLVITTVFRFGAQCERWRNFAWSGLLEEARRQVSEDGVNKEQAIYYHAWVLEYFLVASRAASCAGLDVPEQYLRTLWAMARFLVDISPCADAAEPPQIGDADDGLVIRFSESRTSTYYHDLVASVSLLAGKAVSTDTPPKAIWYASAREPEVPGGHEGLYARHYPVTYANGGYALLGAQGMHLVFDAGPLGYPSIAAHGHADALSICLAVDRQWWLVDPGTYAYHAKGNWRNYFRGTGAHNTVQVNGGDQSQSGGPFLWLKRAKVFMEEEPTSDSGGRQRCAGALRNYHGAEGVELRRSVELDPAAMSVRISDVVAARDTVHIALRFHFAPGVDVELLPNNLCRASRAGSSKTLVIAFSPDLDLRKYVGDEQRMLGWFSPGLGKRVPCTTLSAEAIIESGGSYATEIRVSEE